MWGWGPIATASCLYISSALPSFLTRCPGDLRGRHIPSMLPSLRWVIKKKPGAEGLCGSQRVPKKLDGDFLVQVLEEPLPSPGPLGTAQFLGREDSVLKVPGMIQHSAKYLLSAYHVPDSHPASQLGIFMLCKRWMRCPALPPTPRVPARLLGETSQFTLRC